MKIVAGSLGNDAIGFLTLGGAWQQARPEGWVSRGASSRISIVTFWCREIVVASLWVLVSVLGTLD